MCLTFGIYLVGKIVFLSGKIWEKPGESQGKDQGKFREKLEESREFLKVMSMATMRKSIKSFLCGLHEVYSHIMASSDLFICPRESSRLSRDLVS